MRPLLAGCMADLVREGMVDVYRFSPQTSEYTRMSSIPDDIDTAWFRVNENGRKQLDDHWVDD